MSQQRVSGAHTQRGMGLLSIFVVVAIAIFLGLFAFKVGPHYFENWTVTKIASDAANDAELMKKPRSRVYAYINQAYRTNNLWDLSPEETVTLQKDKERGYVITVNYEKRANLFHNIDVVTRFDKVVNQMP